MTPILKILLFFALIIVDTAAQRESYCPPQELIAPCRCSQKENDIQVWYECIFSIHVRKIENMILLLQVFT